MDALTSSPFPASVGTLEAGDETRLTCPLCGFVHRAVPLRPRDRALCLQCGATLAKGTRCGWDAALAFALTGLILAVPAASMPIATVGKLGNERAGSLFTGIDAFWSADLRLLAIWILVCGVVAPLVLLGTLVALVASARLGRPTRYARRLSRLAHSLQHWAMPEVQVLAVLVAFTKLGSLVDVKIGAGLWSYAAMSVATLVAWRSFELHSPALVARGKSSGRSAP